MSRRYFIAIVLLFLGCVHPESGEYERHTSRSSSLLAKDEDKEAHSSETGFKVIGVKDGDTFVVLMKGREQTVRFAHIDCPEKRQPFGTKAKQFVSDVCFGEFVKLVHDDQFDRNKRLIAEVILHDGANLNKELVKNGLAWHYKKYSNNDEYASLESTARESRLGLWSAPSPIAPWEWRRKR